MKDTNRIHLNIPADLLFERVVRASAAELGTTMGFSDERIEDLKLAVSEAVTNAIEHGSNERQKPVEVVFALHDDMLEVEVIDHGDGLEHFNPEKRVVEEDNLDIGMLRGFGSYLISELVDQYEVQSSSNGTSLRLRIFKPTRK